MTVHKKEHPSSMTRWGIGGIWVRTFVLCSLPFFGLACLFPDFFVLSPRWGWLFRGLGLLLLGVGIPFWFAAARAVTHSFNAGVLYTKGAFAFCRHPIYGAWIFFLIPGMLAFSRSLLLIVGIPLMMYIALRHFLPREEAWLLNLYGSSYEVYAREVPRICPSFINPLWWGRGKARYH